LEADHAAADEHEALRKLRQEQEIVGGDREPAPRNRRHDRLGARGDDDLVALDLPTVGLERVRVDEARLAEVDVRPRLLEGRGGVAGRMVRATWAAPRSAARGSSTSQTGTDAINSANRPLSQNAATNAPSASFALSFGAIPPPR